MSDSATPWTVARQVPLSIGFSRQEYWSRVPFPSPGDLPDPGIKRRSPTLQAVSLLAELPGVKESACNAGDVSLIPGSEGSLEKELATRSSLLAWETPCTEEPGGLQSMRLQELDMT